MKCDACGAPIATTFLKKIIGTYVKVKGKKRTVCFACQKKYLTKDELIAHLQ